MPFVNRKQQQACYAKATQDIKNGIIPKWNCKKFSSHKSPQKKRCNAICQDGYRCKRIITGKYCYQHK